MLGSFDRFAPTHSGSIIATSSEGKWLMSFFTSPKHIGAGSTHVRIYIYNMPLYPHDSLLNFHPNEGLLESLEIFLEISRAGQYLHEIGLIHGDLTST